MKMYLLIVIVIILIIGTILAYGSIYPKLIRPISIKVIDGAIKRPIENCVVYYSLQTSRTKHIFGLRGIDFFDYKYLVKEKYYTDSNGIITIPRRKIYLKLYENATNEYIYINLEKDANSTTDFFKTKEITNEISHLKGALLHTTVNKISSSSLPSDAIRINHDNKVTFNGQSKTNTNKMFVYLVKEKSISKESDKIIIELPEF